MATTTSITPNQSSHNTNILNDNIEIEKANVRFGDDSSSDEHECNDKHCNNTQCNDTQFQKNVSNNDQNIHDHKQCEQLQHDKNIEQNTTYQEDLSRYTVVDHLDEDDPIPGQDYCLFSFLSPEGVMNCNVRAVKFRGAYPTMDAAKKAAMELEKKDKYFKIFIGDSGKWLDFDPPSSKVEREMSSNKDHQKILDAQRKQRMEKINALAGKYKENIDKTDNGKKERIEESKKAGAASDAVDKQRSKKQEKQEKQQEKRVITQANSRNASLEKTKERMRKRIAESKNKKILENMGKEDIELRKLEEANQMKQDNIINIDEKVKVVHKASADLDDKKAKLNEADRNIENIKQLLAKKKAQKN